MKVRAAVAIVIASLLFGAYLLSSGAPPRVHVATAAGLVLAFLVPAMVVGRPGDVWTRRWIVLGLVVFGVAALDVGLSATISKKELFDAPALFIVGVPAMAALLALHGAIVRRVARGAAV
jgi:hypothetical protein